MENWIKTYGGANGLEFGKPLLTPHEIVRTDAKFTEEWENVHVSDEYLYGFKKGTKEK